MAFAQDGGCPYDIAATMAALLSGTVIERVADVPLATTTFCVAGATD